MEIINEISTGILNGLSKFGTWVLFENGWIWIMIGIGALLISVIFKAFKESR